MLLAETYPKFCPECGTHRVTEVDGIPANYCLKCGLEWVKVTQPGAYFTRRMLDMPNVDLLMILKLLYPTMSKMVSQLAEKTGFERSHVSRVLTGQRKNPTIDKAAVEFFRYTLEKRGLGSV